MKATPLNFLNGGYVLNTECSYEDTLENYQKTLDDNSIFLFTSNLCYYFGANHKDGIVLFYVEDSLKFYQNKCEIYNTLFNTFNTTKDVLTAIDMVNQNFSENVVSGSCCG